MARRKKRYYREKKEYPLLQGVLVEDAETITCSTGKYKTCFTVETLESKKHYDCVYWSNMNGLVAGQLVLLKGWLKNNIFVCMSVNRITYPYKFDTG